MTTQAEPIHDLLSERLFTVYEAAAWLKCSRQKATRMFAQEPGVIDIGQNETRYGKPHHVLRIPESVLKRVVEARKR